jgi:DNA-binding transcriptional LysR family regulator
MVSRTLNLRQVEAFRAVVENGTVSAAATALHISQPAVSKLLAHFEHQTGLHLFERVKGRLAPTPQGTRLYEEVDRIFAGIHQLERSVELVKREERGQLVVGVLPALAGHFIQQATMRFLQMHPGVHVSVKVRASPVLTDWLATRQIDIGILNAKVDHPDLELEALMRHRLVCITPLDHPLARRKSVGLRDLAGVPFIAFDDSVQVRSMMDALFAKHGDYPDYVLEATTAPTVCEFVAAGLGVSVVHPMMAGTVRGRVAMVPLLPVTEDHFLLGRARETRNARFVDDFAQATREVASLDN